MFYPLLLLSLVFRVWLAWALPMTGDEAYFYWWGKLPDWGFYDHPPMIGWWLAALLQVADGELWLRLPVIVQPAVLALALRWALPRLYPGMGTERTDAVALLVLLAPVNVWNVLITTDTPLVYFSVFSGLAWLRAAQERAGDGWRWYGLCGALLAGAVLSKYFVAFLGFAYLLDALRRRSRRALGGLLLAYACTLPALALMAWWNAEHCWTNYLFNFVNRHGNAGWSWRTPALYALTLLYALGPAAAWLIWKNRRITSADLPFAQATPVAVLAWVPLALFALLSLIKQIGLHWILSFIPFALIWLALRLPVPALMRLRRFFIGFAALHVILIAVIASLPLETWRTTRFYDGIVLTVEHQALAAELAKESPDTVLAMDGYASAVTLGYNLRRYVPVFGAASSHARHDDIVTDFRTLAGKNILILHKSEPHAEAYRPYFRHLDIDSFEWRGARFWRVRGEGFDYPAYRDGILAAAREKYYRIPPWLPQRQCFLCERYFGSATCPL